MKQMLALMLCAVLALPGCATARATSSRIGPAPPAAQPGGRVDPALMAEYIRQLPVGTRVRLTRTDGTVLRGTLMKRDADPIIVQRRARIPEAPLAIPIGDILALEPELPNGNHAGRSAAIGAAAAAGTVLGVLLLLAAIFSD